MTVVSELTKEDFRRRVHRFVEEAFPSSDGWGIEEKRVDDDFDLILMRRRAAIAIGRIVGEGFLSTEAVRELSDLRDRNQAYLALIYRSPQVQVSPDAASLATRLGVRIIEVK